MKKMLFFLLAAVLLVGTTTQTQAQKHKKLTVAEANAVLQRTAGEWQVGFSLWQPQTRQFITSKGDASFSKLITGNYVREQFTITKPDGTIEEGEGFLSYSEKNRRFEFVQIDNTGKSTLLLTGQWYPENSTLLLRTEGDLQQWGSNDGVPMQLQYTFLEDGTFLKAVRMPDARGDYNLISTYHYKNRNYTKL